MRLFVAVRPSVEAADVLDRGPRPAAPRMRWLPREQWHVTLRFLGEADPDEVAGVLAGVPWVDVPAVDVALGPATALLGTTPPGGGPSGGGPSGGGVVMVPAVGCDGLADRVVAATDGLGRPPEERPFVGHLTLGRFRDGPPAGSVGTPVSATFRADEVLLVSSRTRPEGAVHRVVARYRLGVSAPRA